MDRLKALLIRSIPLVHILAFGIITLIVDVGGRSAPWNVEELARTGVVALSTAMAIVTLLFLRSRKTSITFIVGVAVVVASFGSITVAAALLDLLDSNDAEFVTAFFACATFYCGIIVLFSRKVAFLLTSIAVATAGGWGYLRADVANWRPRSYSSEVINTSLYSLRLTHIDDNIPQRSSGGGFTLVGDALLIATADGDFKIVDRPTSTKPQTTFVPAAAGLNRTVFEAEVAGTGSARWFRVLDVLARSVDADSTFEIFLSRHHWDPSQRCFFVELIKTTADAAALASDLSTASWAVVNRTVPCLPLVSAEPGWPFRGMESGGRLAFLDSSTVLMTIGDHGFNGVDFGSQPDLVQDSAASYGKTLRVDLQTGAARVFTTGHRNPQGLYVDDESRVWSTEHGPQGGDELNLLSEGRNYGWPLVTYGTEYGRQAWPLNARQGRHDGYSQPVFSWVPSIGISNLLLVRGELFSLWSGDLVLTSLVGQRLVRVHLEEGQVRVTETIPVGQGIRDALQLKDGTISLLTNGNAVILIRPTQNNFARCEGCHASKPGASSRLGPALHGVFGRAIASASGFQYSDGMKALDGRWTEARLDAFLADPHRFAPGTSMRLEGITDAVVRAELIRYLRDSMP